jgi:DNA-binding MltR family transcriptional regulator
MEDQTGITIEQWHLKDFIPFMIRLSKESDRGAVLMATGYLEKMLKDILQAYFIKGSSSDALFENGALATFSARTAACHALGLISDDEFHNIQLIRKIRNYLAHELHSTFDDPSVVDRCKLLRLKAHDYGDVVVGTTGQFQTAAVAVLNRLINRAHYVSLKRSIYGEWQF